MIYAGDTRNIRFSRREAFCAGRDIRFSTEWKNDYFQRGHTRNRGSFLLQFAEQAQHWGGENAGSPAQ